MEGLGGSCFEVFGFFIRVRFFFSSLILYVLFFLNCRVKNNTLLDPPKNCFCKYTAYSNDRLKVGGVTQYRGGFPATVFGESST